MLTGIKKKIDVLSIINLNLDEIQNQISESIDLPI